MTNTNTNTKTNENTNTNTNIDIDTNTNTTEVAVDAGGNWVSRVGWRGGNTGTGELGSLILFCFYFFLFVLLICFINSFYLPNLNFYHKLPAGALGGKRTSYVSVCKHTHVSLVRRVNIPFQM